MNRRESLRGLGLLAGSHFLPPALLADFLQSAAAVKEGRSAWVPRIVSAEQAKLLPELVEVILPATDTPGAKDALVHVFVDLYVKDCYPAPQQEAFLKGLDGVDALGKKEHGRSFLELSGEQRLGLLSRMERESFERNEPVEQSFIRMLKNLTLLGYFSSEPGATRGAEYIHDPGPFKGCVDLKPGQKADVLT
jgi:hypothetical protein